MGVLRTTRAVDIRAVVLRNTVCEEGKLVDVAARTGAIAAGSAEGDVLRADALRAASVRFAFLALLQTRLALHRTHGVQALVALAVRNGAEVIEASRAPNVIARQAVRRARQAVADLPIVVVLVVADAHVGGITVRADALRAVLLADACGAVHIAL